MRENPLIKVFCQAFFKKRYSSAGRGDHSVLVILCGQSRTVPTSGLNHSNPPISKVLDGGLGATSFKKLPPVNCNVFSKPQNSILTNRKKRCIIGRSTMKRCCLIHFPGSVIPEKGGGLLPIACNTCLQIYCPAEEAAVAGRFFAIQAGRYINQNVQKGIRKRSDDL